MGCSLQQMLIYSGHHGGIAMLVKLGFTSNEIGELLDATGSAGGLAPALP